MVVDDDEVIRQLIAVNLTLEGFDVVTAVDGKDCLDKVLEAKPDVITLDVMMPRLDGWVTATQLRRNPQTAGIKVVLITARAQEDDRSRGRQIGVDAYLTKPFDPAEMIPGVRELAGAPASVFDRSGQGPRADRGAVAWAPDPPAHRPGPGRHRGRHLAGRARDRRPGVGGRLGRGQAAGGGRGHRPARRSGRG